MDKRFNRIGVFDSGIGGLTVLKELLSLMPDVNMVYLGDCARLPYGIKSSKTIIRYSQQCARFLISKDIDMLVIACNTASAHAIPALEADLKIPVIGVIEAGAEAAIAENGNRIGVIGTISTIKSQAYVQTLRRLKPGAAIFSQACPLFVPLVEEGWFDDDITEQVARRYLEGLKQSRIDTLLLGCTHYPLIKGVLSKVMGDGIQIVDSALSTARFVARMFGQEDRKNSSPDVDYYLSDLSERFISLGEIFLGQKMKHVYDVDLSI